ncbi:hypothetical protein CYMTET_40044 [Cymbomonas tetramitiformis]|uniref:Uncharacterized protein n=1 Tax=Cymbomonas tetramitiformis TaxID=36881 RepID=A0AAE0F419_9CHLO|nr:hypothetical protein CYMTET_40044 [Cymbomonas tetramitiformis]
MQRCLGSCAWVRARRSHFSKVFLVPKPEMNKWRLVMDFRWLNSHCLMKTLCKMEKLKEAAMTRQAKRLVLHVRPARRVPPDGIDDGGRLANKLADAGKRSTSKATAKKGKWESTQLLVEHLGSEVDLKVGQFRVTPARLQKIHEQAKALVSEASRQRQWLPAWRLAAFAGLC